MEQMRVEDVEATEESARRLNDLNDAQLLDLHDRCLQVWRASRRWMAALRKNLVGACKPIERDRLLAAYDLLAAEIGKRGLQVKPNALATKMLGKRLRGLDVAELRPVVVRESTVAVGGRFAANPASAQVVDVYVDAGDMSDGFADLLEARLVEGLVAQSNRPVVVHRGAEGIGERVVPMFDLLLVPRETTEDEPAAPMAKRLSEDRVKAARNGDSAGGVVTTVPEPEIAPAASLGGQAAVIKLASSPLVAELRPAGDFDHLETVQDKFGTGIHGVWGQAAGKDQLQAVVFDDLGEEAARGWLLGKGLAAKLSRQVAPTEFVKIEEERIVGGVVYGLGSVEKADAQGDFIDDIREIWKALKSWMIGTGGRMKIMHEGRAVNVPVVECFLCEGETHKAGKVLEKGDWYLSVHVPETEQGIWQAIKRGEITGFSMAGRGRAQTV